MAKIDQDDWANAYLSEIDRVGHFSNQRVLNSVFFGGGTPSLMDSSLVERILDRVQATWPLANDIEITLEANPTSVEASRFSGYKQAGVNRVSLGIQALNNHDLRVLGRLHSVEDALNALEIARSTFDRTNFDLIYARQDQTLRDWSDELQKALSFEPSHLSLYQLTIEENTAFGDRFAKGLLRGLPDEDRAADMFLFTQEETAAAGLPAYEVSNHARQDQESKHNLIYWRGGDYLGIGPGAHGRYSIAETRYATETVLSPAAWLDAVRKTGTGTSVEDVITKNDQATEYLLMSLRLAQGCDLDRLNDLAPKLISERGLENLLADGFVEMTDRRLVVPPSQRILLNKILEELIC